LEITELILDKAVAIEQKAQVEKMVSKMAKKDCLLVVARI